MARFDYKRVKKASGHYPRQSRKLTPPARPATRTSFKKLTSFSPSGSGEEGLRTMEKAAEEVGEMCEGSWVNLL